MGVVIRCVAASSSVGFVDGAAHGVGHLVGMKDGAAFEVAGGAPDGLDERALGAEEAFLVGVEDGDEGTFDRLPNGKLSCSRFSRAA